MKDKHHSSTESHEFHWTMDGIRREAEPLSARHAPRPSAEDDEITPKESDQRRFPRIDLNLPILYRVMPEEPLVASRAAEPDQSSRGGNISPTGACLVLAEKLPRGTVLALSLHVTDRGAISAVGKVVWAKSTETAHHFLTGLEFVAVYRKTRKNTEYLSVDVFQSLLGHPPSHSSNAT